MLKYILYSLLLLALAGIGAYFLFEKNGYSADEVTLANGKVLFTKNCMSCHSLEGDGIGPPLGGITEVLSKDDLVDFVRDPSKQIEAKEERAVRLQARYKQVMPGFDWMKETEISSILSYIENQTRVYKLVPLSVS